MQQPPLEDLLKKVDSKYTLVVATAKWARELMVRAAEEGNEDDRKPVTVAMEDILAGRIRYERIQS